ncbi:FtsX-like permease family protein [Mucilaginibacter sp. RS28]|uniref:FtsX-like permease family protein n=1 Tax=Mucilaginibacter straminoryzae TaxID=2932774 RepID=A0A9X2B8K9_9SPHI|nr:FtsX-like permease family protein [Mucilaginibacter straminoryzae]MCJ8209566.1 FtsX-like permease family protein [Mucilaginibacter straminoryzae]
MAATNLKIARVHLTSRLRQTIVALLGVTFGISMYVFMNSFMSGVNDMQNVLAFTTLAHIHIYNDGPADNTNLVKKVYPANTAINIRNAKVIQYTEGIKNTAAILDLVRKQPEVLEITPQVNINAFFRNGGNKLNGTLSGVDVEKENKLFNTSQYMISGQWNNLQYRPDGIIIGADLAHDLSLNVDDNVNILTSDGVSRNYKLIGIFQTNIKSVDKAKAYINITAARQLMNKNQEYVTDLQVNIADFEKTAPVVQRIAPVIPYKVESWQMSNQQLEAGSKLRNAIAMAVSLTILLVAGFGIYNIMNMTINEKIREIAILKAMGFSSGDVTEIFLTQAIVIGVIGGLVGMLIGFIIADIVNHIPFKIGPLNNLPMGYHVQDYVMAFMFGLITTLVAGYLPARKASKIDPVEIIRG